MCRVLSFGRRVRGIKSTNGRRLRLVYVRHVTLYAPVFIPYVYLHSVSVSPPVSFFFRRPATPGSVLDRWEPVRIWRSLEAGPRRRRMQSCMCIFLYGRIIHSVCQRICSVIGVSTVKVVRADSADESRHYFPTRTAKKFKSIDRRTTPHTMVLHTQLHYYTELLRVQLEFFRKKSI